MSIITFKMADVKPLVAAAKSRQTILPTSDDLYDPNMHKNGIMLDNKGRTEEQAENEDGYFFPDEANLDKTKLIKKLTLVGDHGVYLITNVKLHAPHSKLGLVAYANGCNPTTDEDWWDTKADLFGTSDDSVSFPLAWAEKAIAANKRTFKLKLHEDSIELLL